MGKALSNAEIKRRAKAAAAQEAAEKLFFLHHQKDSGFDARMPELLAALKRDNPPGALINRFCDPETAAAYLATNDPVKRCPGLNLACYLKDKPLDAAAPSASADEGAEASAGAGSSAPAPATTTSTGGSTKKVFTPAKADRFGTLVAYHMDAASLLAVMAADIQPDDKVLDICAAPGGKALAACQFLGPKGSLVANDVSPDRRRRLTETLSFYLPKRAKRLAFGGAGDDEDDGAFAGAGGFDSVMVSKLGAASGKAEPGSMLSSAAASSEWQPPVPPTVTVVGYDGTVAGAFGSDCFDKVLLDAPCTSDRHLVHDPEELAKFGPGKIKGNAARQAALLAVALDAVKTGGTVIYSTCALSSKENDGVVERVVPAMPFPVTVVPLKFAFGEQTPIGGVHVLPDRSGGFGVLYICKLIKGYRKIPKSLTVRGDYSEAGPVATSSTAPAASTAAPASESTPVEVVGLSKLKLEEEAAETAAT